MMSRCKRFVCSLVKAGALLGPIALAATPAAPALAATTDPFQVLYLFPGVRDTGNGVQAGVATVVHCFSFSSTPETVQYIVRNFQGTIAVNVTHTLNPFETRTAATHDTVLYDEDVFLNTLLIDQGTLGIAATNPNIVCNAQVIDASVLVPNGIDLHAIRFTPIPGSQE